MLHAQSQFSADGVGRFQRPAADEDAPGGGRGACSVGVEQVVAPGDRVAHRLLAGRQVARRRRSAAAAAAPAGPAAPAAASTLDPRAAASSIASGSPSSRAQIAATAGAFSLGQREVGATACARSTKSRTAAVLR